ncbi:hypothetical protein LTR64_008422 [Lithohypha guttulata]|uniref:uncharacterized protein n=1 Tax=Lithohypha guttulata TaxID=1690604 RepID=UPI00315CF2C4
MSFQGVHLCGSLPFESAQESFEQIGSALGDYLYRLPDGETNDGRQIWLLCQSGLFEGGRPELMHPDLKVMFSHLATKGASDKAAQAEQALDYEAILQDFQPNYDTWAIESYRIFKQLKESGKLAQHLKFQVSVPTPLAVVTLLIAVNHRSAIEPIYTRKLRECILRMQAEIPHQDLAIQWDCAAEIAMIENVPGYAGMLPEFFVPHFEKGADVQAEAVTRMIDLASWIDADVELGYHLCYGDLGHQPFKQATDVSVLADVIETLCSNIDRSLEFVHIPVPLNEVKTYLQPLTPRALKMLTERKTHLFLGLVNGNREQEVHEAIEVARKLFVNIPASEQLRWGIASQCGIGRTPKEEAEGVVNITRRLAEPVVMT